MSLTDLKERLEKLGRLEQRIHGARYEVVFDYARVVAFFQQEETKPVYVELPWYEKIEGQIFTYNHVIVQSLSAEKVCFLNPLPQADVNAGVKGGNAEGPEREVFSSHTEMNALLFQRLFRLGGGALLPCKHLSVR